MKEKIENLIKEVLKNLDINEDIIFSIEHPEDFKNGDYSTNVAMVCFSYLKDVVKKEHDLEKRNQVDMNLHRNGFSINNPLELAEGIKKELEKNLPKEIEKVEVAPPGFINFYLSKDFFESNIKEILDKKKDWGKNDLLSGKKVMVEYTDPNPFKPFHIGHLMANAIGESISRIVEFSGAKTIRANYQGDVGPHVAKAIYGLIEFGLPNEDISVSEKAQYIGDCYSKGSNLYDTDENVKKEIDEINKKIYDKSDEEINKIYDWGRKITLEAFEEIYKILGTKFDYYFFESEMAVKGEKIVRENIKSLPAGRQAFDESDGAIIFHGENYDKKLHTRVFINSQGLPTYETKEIGLTLTKFEKENPDISIITTAIEQAEYMKVVQKAISLMHPDLEKRMKHITHGMMKLTTGKMSSRKGNVITGESLLRDSMDVVFSKMTEREFSLEDKKEISEVVGVAALKYSILKSSLGSDIVYDFDKSISFDGDSGPYLQYTAVRAMAILRKALELNLTFTDYKKLDKVPEEIVNLEKGLYQFPEVVLKSYELLEPHHITTYLTELASAFNTFYRNVKILDSENHAIIYHLELVKAFYQTMENGLWLLGIKIPEKM